MNPQQPHQVRNQQPQNEPGGPQPPHNNQPQAGGSQPSGNRWYQPTLESKIVVALIIIAGLAVLGTLVAGMFLETRNGTGQSMVKSDQYQAVFLTNDQVYFGDITKADNGRMVLENVYYLQVNQQIQPEQGSAQNNQQQPEVSLAKLGNELHAPEDRMFISSDKVVFWENLKSDGQVARAIRQNEQNQQNQQNQQSNNGMENPTEQNQQDQSGTSGQQGTGDTNGQSGSQQGTSGSDVETAP